MDRVIEAWKYLLLKMKQYQHVVGLFLTCLVLLLRFIPSENQSASLETRLAPLPSTVVSNNSRIFDSCTGNMKIIDYVNQHSEISIVVYYAPWCAKSIDVLREMEEVAKVLYRQVSFVAINCWWVRGECRGLMQFNKYPQVFVHHKNMKQDIVYNGPLKKNHIEYFLKKIMKPVTYLSTKNEVGKFLDENQITVLTTFSPHSFEESQNFIYYSAIAIKQMETYHLPVGFGVITNPQLAKIYFLKSNILQVRNNMKPREVVHLSLLSSMQEIMKSLQKFKKYLLSPDLHFSGAKSNLLYQTIHKGPTLIVFVSATTVEKREKYVRKVQQLAFQYQYCPKEYQKSPTRPIYTANQSPENQCCQTTIFKDQSEVSLACSICAKQENTKENKIFYPQCDAIQNFVEKIYYKDATWAISMQRKVDNSEGSQICEDVLPSYQQTFLSICCESKTVVDVDSWRRKSKKNQNFCVENILNKAKKLSSISTDNEETVISDTSEVDDSIIFTDKDSLINTDSVISGISCTSNRTLQFLTLDFDRHKKLSENLGVEPWGVYNVGDAKMGAVIFDPVNELRHVMSSSHFHLENFIINYTLGILPRNYRASEKTAQCSSSSMQSCIQEVTSETFKSIALDSEKDVLLFYYAPWCLACTSVSHIYHSLAQLLHLVPSVLIARIDAYENELPTQFTVQSYPSLMLFPAKRSSYSVVFPQDVDITVANLLWFLLNNISWESSRSILYTLCTSGDNHKSIQTQACIQWNAIKSKS